MQLRLTTKFTLVTSAVLISAMLLFAYFSIRSLEQTCVTEAVKDIDNLSETILRTTFHQMLEDDRARVYQTIAEVGFQRGVRHIRLINKDGLIRYSTRPEEVGHQVDKGEPSCNMCHGRVTVEPLLAASSMSRSRQFVDEQGETVMGMARAIYNQASCSTAACHEHPAGDQLLGVLDVTVSLEEMTASTAGFREQMILATLGLLFTLGASLAVVIRRFIHRPVRDLLAHTRRLAQGDLDGQIETLARDELGELEVAFNEMTHNLRRVQGELRELAASLECKVEERTRQVQDIQGRLVRSEKLASLGELVAGIAHEINNPLTGIMVFSSLALENASLPQPLRDDLSVINRETQRCTGIVRRLLEFAREAPPDKNPESINHLLDHTLRLLENQMTFQNISITRNYAEQLPQLQVDANQISQVFMNILLNAAQAMPQGGSLVLETALAGAGGGVLVRMCDSGSGIAEQDLKRIFDPFFTTKKESGTGLGLSVTYGILENHGGTIDVESTLGAGTTFTITLPLALMENGRKDRADAAGVAGTGEALPA